VDSGNFWSIDEDERPNQLILTHENKCKFFEQFLQIRIHSKSNADGAKFWKARQENIRMIHILYK
jgi:hypothetical protein